MNIDASILNDFATFVEKSAASYGNQSPSATPDGYSQTQAPTTTKVTPLLPPTAPRAVTVPGVNTGQQAVRNADTPDSSVPPAAAPKPATSPGKPLKPIKF